jgi:hypothetical protein
LNVWIRRCSIAEVEKRLLGNLLASVVVGDTCKGRQTWATTMPQETDDGRLSILRDCEFRCRRGLVSHDWILGRIDMRW